VEEKRFSVVCMNEFGASTLAATAVLLLLPDQADTPVAVLIDSPRVPSSVLLDVLDRRCTFVRLRRGPNAHGLSEPYRQLSRDEAANCVPVETVTHHRYVQARFARSASLFGAPDTVAFVPVHDGRPYERVRIPIPSLDRQSWHDFVLSATSRTECTYRIATPSPIDVARQGDTDALSPERA
jgi:hypothetical protein